jgi:hypothetical protein
MARTSHWAAALITYVMKEMEPTMAKLGTLISAATLSVALVASPALAHGGGHGGGFHGGFHGGFRDGFHDRFHPGFRGDVFGGGFYDPFLYDPYLGGYPYAYSAPPAGVWYLCPTANAYYPAVTSCPVPWQPFAAR